MITVDDQLEAMANTIRESAERISKLEMREKPNGDHDYVYVTKKRKSLTNNNLVKHSVKKTRTSRISSSSEIRVMN